VFFRVSGGLFNPAVTVGLFLCGALTWYRSIILFIVQFIAAIAAAGIAQLVIPGGINARTKLGTGTGIAQGWVSPNRTRLIRNERLTKCIRWFIEMFCTAMLMFAIYMLAGEKHKATFLAPVGIGLALFLCELFATGLTGGSLNPARTLGKCLCVHATLSHISQSSLPTGPDVIAAEFDGTTWIYYTAPFVGTFLSAGVYWLLKVSRYETANEGQDGDETAQALVLRDTKGNITGAVERVDIDRAPELVPALNVQSGVSRNPSVTSLVDPNQAGANASVPNLPAGAPQAVQLAAATDGGHIAQPGITVEDTDKQDTSSGPPASSDRRDFSPAPPVASETARRASVASVGKPATLKDLGLAKKADEDVL
jgi:glycerol uptake facilitator-like aquaporin